MDTKTKKQAVAAIRQIVEAAKRLAKVEVRYKAERRKGRTSNAVK